MKLLIISYIYAPDTSPRAFRWSAIAEHLARQGHRIDVVTSWKRGDRHRENRNGVAVYRIGGSVEQLRSLFSESSHRGPLMTTENEMPRSIWKRAAKRLYQVTLRQLFWPDYAFHWYGAAARIAKKLGRSAGYDAVISVSHPFTGHLVGLAVKRAAPGLRWVADIGDPFSLLDEIAINNNRLYRNLNRRGEAAILSRCDAVAVTVERCRQDYLDAFSLPPEKISVIPPLLSLPPPAETEDPIDFGPDGVHLVFSGTLYHALRNPEALLALFGELRRRRSDLHLHFYGCVNDCAEAFARLGPEAESGIHLHGQVPRSTVMAAMRAADILVNIGNSTAHQLPSKLVEYAAMGRPIFNLAVNPSDSAAAFLAGYPSALTILGAGAARDEALIAQILAFIVAPPAINPHSVAAFLAPYGIGPVADSYLRLAAPEPISAAAELCDAG